MCFNKVDKAFSVLLPALLPWGPWRNSLYIQGRPSMDRCADRPVVLCIRNPLKHYWVQKKSDVVFITARVGGHVGARDPRVLPEAKT